MIINKKRKDSTMNPNTENTQVPPENAQTAQYCCDNCDENFDADEALNLADGSLVCEPCQETCAICTDCGEADFSSDMNYDNVYTNEYYCNNCFSDAFWFCEDCSTHLQDEDMYRSQYDDEARCRSCHNEHNASRSIIRNYNYKPSPIFYHAEGLEKHHQGNKETRLFFGFELEVERGEDCDWSCTDVAQNIRIFLEERALGNLLYFKWDGSLSDGFEIISHPMSFAFFKQNKTLFEDLLKLLRNHNMTSYDAGSCGLHIHISRQAFTHSHFLKFQNFWNTKENTTLLISLSQRQKSQMDNYCRLRDGARSKENLIKMAKLKGYADFDGRRMSALNCQNDKTIEVRIFRGTLNRVSFFKCFESVFAIFDFTKKMSFKSLKITRKSMSESATKVKDLIAQNGNLDGWIAPVSKELINRNYFYAYVKGLKKSYKNLDRFLGAQFGSYYKVNARESVVNELNTLIKNERMYL